jgi:hypothetical protein
MKRENLRTVEYTPHNGGKRKGFFHEWVVINRMNSPSTVSGVIEDLETGKVDIIHFPNITFLD